MDYLLILIAATTFWQTMRASDTNSVQSEENNVPYCFRYTWLGPKFASVHIKNRTCAALLGKAELICVQPLITTDNSQPPDSYSLWKSLSTNITCQLLPGDVCVKYTYIYNKAVENITYTCTKVNIENEGPVSSGCYTQFQNGREIEVCVCESSGNRIPCNSSHKNSITQVFHWTMCTLIIVYLLKQ